jgi:hypothetical protein
MDMTERFFAALTAVGIIGFAVSYGWVLFFA